LSVKAGSTARLYAKADLPDTYIQRVWVAMTPPDSLSVGKTPITNLEEIELSYNSSGKRYEGTLSISASTQSGQYTLSYFVMDKDGLISQEPPVDFLTITGGSESSCITQSSDLNRNTLVLHINNLQIPDTAGFYDVFYHLGFKYISGSNPLQFVFQYLDQPQNSEYCSIEAATFSISSGLLTIPSIFFDDSIIFKNAVFKLKEKGIIELKSIE